MTWEEKFDALRSIADICLRMRKPGDWYVSPTRRWIGGDGLLTGTYGNGRTPEEAVEDDWRQLVEMLPGDRYIVVEDGPKRRQLRWSGYMWRDVL